jgi:hypothetical protein
MPRISFSTRGIQSDKVSIRRNPTIARESITWYMVCAEITATSLKKVFSLPIVVSFQFDMIEPHTTPLRVFFGLIGDERPQRDYGGTEETECEKADQETAVDERQEGSHEGQDTKRKGDF